MVEQGTHKPLDVGSNPTLATIHLILLIAPPGIDNLSSQG
jgi:hypothetical protein